MIQNKHLYSHIKAERVVLHINVWKSRKETAPRVPNFVLQCIKSFYWNSRMYSTWNPPIKHQALEWRTLIKAPTPLAEDRNINVPVNLLLILLNAHSNIEISRSTFSFIFNCCKAACHACLNELGCLDLTTMNLDYTNANLRIHPCGMRCTEVHRKVALRLFAIRLFCTFLTVTRLSSVIYICFISLIALFSVNAPLSLTAVQKVSRW